jgi:hypothetical protein
MALGRVECDFVSGYASHVFTEVFQIDPRQVVVDSVATIVGESVDGEVGLVVIEVGVELAIQVLQTVPPLHDNGMGNVVELSVADR